MTQPMIVKYVLPISKRYKEHYNIFDEAEGVFSDLEAFSITNDSLNDLNSYYDKTLNINSNSTYRDSLSECCRLRHFYDGFYNNKNKKKISKKGVNANMYNIIKSNNPLIIRAESAISRYCINKIKTTFGVKVQLEFDHITYKKFLCWLKKYDKLFARHISKYPYKPYYILKDADFFIKISDYTFARILTGNSINRHNDNDNRNTKVFLVEMYIFGKDSKNVAYELDKICRGNNSNQIVLYTVTVHENDKYRDKPSVDIYRDLSSGRNKDSVFLNDDIKDTILNHIRKFFNNKSIYTNRNLIYKTGILLYGEPGTGKTTIANMIATEFNCDMVIIKMSQFTSINTDFLTSTLNADDKTYIVVLEDIDCVIGDRESENEDLENKKNVNKLLQFLDSASSPSNVIFIATTNHIEKLDNAILRDGRFDLKVNITNINETAASQMCRSFGIKNESTIKRIFKDNNVNGKINPAKLQNIILEEIG